MSEGGRTYFEERARACMRAMNESSCFVGVIPSHHSSFQREPCMCFKKALLGQACYREQRHLLILFLSPVTFAQELLRFPNDVQHQGREPAVESHVHGTAKTTHPQTCFQLVIRVSYRPEINSGYVHVCLISIRSSLSVKRLQHLGHLEFLCEEQQIEHFGAVNAP